MSDIDRRDKMISLRLSMEEYEALKAHYRAYGARSVSELARLGLQRIMTGRAGRQDAVAAKLTDLDERVHQLESRVSLLLERERAAI